MQSFLKTKTVRIEALDRELGIVELCAKAQIEIMEAIRDEQAISTHFIACKYGVPEWAEESIESISTSLPLQAAREIAEAVYELSGIDDAKNSESAPSEDSSSD